MLGVMSEIFSRADASVRGEGCFLDVSRTIPFVAGGQGSMVDQHLELNLGREQEGRTLDSQRGLSSVDGGEGMLNLYELEEEVEIKRQGRDLGRASAAT